MKIIILKLISLYSKGLKKSIKTGKCIYYPTCSVYASECFKRFNTFKATSLTIKRLIRCNPSSEGGYDPVPLKKHNKYRIINNCNKIVNLINSNIFIEKENTSFNDFLEKNSFIIPKKLLNIYDY